MGRALAGETFYSCAQCELMPLRMAQLGHDGAPSFPWTENLATGEPLERCPIRQMQLADPALRAEIRRWKEVYFPLYQKGHLLVAGGVADQPARYVDAMLYLEQLEDTKNEKYLEHVQKEGAS